jgi:hypothetical protein
MFTVRASPSPCRRPFSVGSADVLPAEDRHAFVRRRALSAARAGGGIATAQAGIEVDVTIFARFSQMKNWFIFCLKFLACDGVFALLVLCSSRFRS